MPWFAAAMGSLGSAVGAGASAAGSALASAPAAIGGLAKAGAMNAGPAMASAAKGMGQMGSGMVGNMGQAMPAGVAGPAQPASGFMGTLSSGGIPAGTFSNLGSAGGIGNALGSLAASRLIGGGGGGLSMPSGQVYGTPTQGMDQQQLLSMILQQLLQR